jgi:hypothetical protein
LQVTIKFTSYEAKIVALRTSLTSTDAALNSLGSALVGGASIIAGSATFDYVAPPTAPAPSGSIRYDVKLTFSGAAPSGDALSTFKSRLASKLADELFGGKFAASSITVTTSEGQRRLLAFTVRDPGGR